MKELYGQSLVNELADSDRIASAIPNQTAAKNILFSKFWAQLKSIFGTNNWSAREYKSSPCIVIYDKKLYLLNESLAPLPFQSNDFNLESTDGKWINISSGTGHTIKDDTQSFEKRDSLKFIGDLKITNNTTETIVRVADLVSGSGVTIEKGWENKNTLLFNNNVKLEYEGYTGYYNEGTGLFYKNAAYNGLEINGQFAVYRSVDLYGGLRLYLTVISGLDILGFISDTNTASDEPTGTLSLYSQILNSNILTDYVLEDSIFYLKNGSAGNLIKDLSKTIISVNNTDSFTVASNAEIEAGTENTKGITSLGLEYGFNYKTINKVFSGLLTSAKTLIGSINELFTSLGLKQTANAGICQIQYLTENDIIIDCVSATPTLTIATVRNGTTITASNPICFYTDGGGVVTKHEKSTAIVFPFAYTYGIWYFYFDSTGAPIASQTPFPDFATIATVYRLLVNDTLVGAERGTVESVEYHQNDISANDHAWKHSQGTVHLSGFDAIANILASGAPNADGRNTCLSLTSGSNLDDNLKYAVTHATGGTTKFTQDLGVQSALTLTTLNGGLFKTRINDAGGKLFFLPPTRFPFAWDSATNRPQYITQNGTRTLVNSGDFFVYFVYALQEPRRGQAVSVVSANVSFGTLPLAQEFAWETMQGLYATLADKEIRPLYKVIFEYRSSYNVACKYSVIRQIDDIRKLKTTTVSATAGSVLASNVISTPPSGFTGTNQQTLDNEFAAAIRVATIKNTIPFTGEFYLNCNETHYNEYNCISNVVLTIGASAFIGAFDRVVMVANGTNTPVFDASWIKRTGSYSYSIVNGKKNEIIITKLQEGIQYTINYLN